MITFKKNQIDFFMLKQMTSPLLMFKQIDLIIYNNFTVTSSPCTFNSLTMGSKRTYGCCSVPFLLNVFFTTYTVKKKAKSETMV